MCAGMLGQDNNNKKIVPHIEFNQVFILEINTKLKDPKNLRIEMERRASPEIYQQKHKDVASCNEQAKHEFIYMIYKSN